jgi:hypothetical protein
LLSASAPDTVCAANTGGTPVRDGRPVSTRLITMHHPLVAEFFPLGLEFPARMQLAMDLLHGLLRVIALENSIQPQFFPKYSFNPPSLRPFPFQALSIHIIHVAESLPNFFLTYLLQADKMGGV